ncbi:MAG: ATP-dependent DNA ligase [Rubrivivax sp.]|nr:ATP-dependent DNA ligase [Rubrivivax sp.]
MRRFAALFDALDVSTASGDKLAALQQYFGAAPPEDAAWAVHLLLGGRLRQVLPAALMRSTVCALADIPDWLFEASHQSVGDLAETIAHVLPPPAQPSDQGLAYWVEQRLLPLRGLSPDEQAARLRQALSELDAPGRFVFVKLSGGGFRSGFAVDRLLLQRALALHAGIDGQRVAQRLLSWTDARATVSAERFRRLVAPTGDGVDTVDGDLGRPYAFCRAQTMLTDPTPLGPLRDWQLEWQYAGLRAQLIRRGGRCWIWSSDDELLTDRLPELVAQASTLPDGCALDGELLVWPANHALPSSLQQLQARMARKTLSKTLLADAPVVFIAYDLLQRDGLDLRERPLHERREQLEDLLQGHALRLSPLLLADDGAALAALRAQARQRGAVGLMLKQRDAGYGSGRSKSDGSWWAWKLDPLTVNAVLTYAQAGQGRGAGVCTEYSFAVWSRPPRDANEAQAVVDAIAARRPYEPGALQLVAIGKADCGLSDADLAQVDREVRAHTLEKFGPVRSLRPNLVLELAFDGIDRSARHKSGIVLRSPRMLRICHDKPLHQAASLPALRAMAPGRATASAAPAPACPGLLPTDRQRGRSRER